MTDREIVNRIIRQKNCRGIVCSDCPLSSFECKDYENVLALAKQWLKDHPESEYTYLDIDLPEWWDGRPIYGEAWDGKGDRKDKVYCFGIDHVAEDLPYACRTEDFEIYRWYRHFKPLLKPSTSAKVVIAKDGNTTEVELTADQIERLGIK